jgi:hypothetical protein
MTVRVIVAFVAAFLLPGPARAADSGELESIRREIDSLKATYEGRLQALEARLQALQQRPAADPAGAAASAAPAVPAAAVAGTASADAAPAAQGSASGFNPAISLILGGTYASLSRDPARYRLQGFVPSGGEVSPGPRGFSLGESELTLAASVDPTFSGRFTASITGDNAVEVEEAIVERQGLFEGATLRVGRFLSSIGYLNAQHAHTWDFVDAPLAYQAFLGGPLKTDGLHLHWLAPIERYVELGVELGAGRGFPGSDRGRNGIGSTALFGHVGDDLGESASWRAGVSLLATRAADRRFDDRDAAGDPVTNRFDGRSRTWVVDAIYKWAPGGNATRTNLKLQGEYFRRTESGTLGQQADSVAVVGPYRSTQSGWYLQAVYQFMPMWRVGARYDRLDSGSPRIGQVASGALSAADFPILQSARPSRTSLMLDWSPSEFSRLRLQLGADRSNPAATDRQLFLQYIMSLGAHGAHSF